jgi:hypothetical protein
LSMVSTMICVHTILRDQSIQFKVCSPPAYGTSNVRINLQFIEDKTEAGQGFDLRGNGGHAILVIKNWINALPMAIEKPIELGVSDGKKIVFLFTGYAVGGLKRMDLTFLWEKKNDHQ